MNRIPTTWIFDIDHPGELDAGIISFSDQVFLTVASGDPGGENGEFTEFMRKALEEWYDGAGVSEPKTRKP